VGLVPALAIMLGANVGTTLIVQVLSFNMAAIAPVLFVLGLVVAFRSGPRSRIKDLGRVAIGLGLMLLSLHILLDTLTPAEDAPGVHVILNAITGDPVLCIIIIGAAVTWLVHSSVASVLLVMSLAYAHFISPSAALAPISAAPSIRSSSARGAMTPRATVFRSAICSTAWSVSSWSRHCFGRSPSTCRPGSQTWRS
jgi:phosphate:Na+ symporter